MPTIFPEETFDDEAECIPHGSRLEPGRGQKPYPAAAGFERRNAAPRRSGPQARVVDRLAGTPSTAPGLTPTQWLAQWCCLDEQK
jgi:hypothetical protein